MSAHPDMTLDIARTHNNNKQTSLLQGLAEMVEDHHLQEGRLYPPLSDVCKVSTRLATRVAEHVYSLGMAGTYPEPEDKAAFVRLHQFKPEYDNMVPSTYPWPGMPFDE